MNRTILFLLIPFALAACEQLGIDDPVKVAEKQDAEGRAVGSACRHSGRGLEDCYAINKKSSKAAIFAGWREMDGYMRENKIDTVKSEPDEAEPKATATEKTGDAAGKATNKAAAPPGDKTDVKAPAKGKKTALLRRNVRLT
ncbi:MAG: hypothetical protein Q8O25_15325 [Sulfurisoma sp.]|nr:hypothetical protein [Sulfurisoma sp.]